MFRLGDSLSLKFIGLGPASWPVQLSVVLDTGGALVVTHGVDGHRRGRRSTARSTSVDSHALRCGAPVRSCYPPPASGRMLASGQSRRAAGRRVTIAVSQPSGRRRAQIKAMAGSTPSGAGAVNVIVMDLAVGQRSWRHGPRPSQRSAVAHTTASRPVLPSRPLGIASRADSRAHAREA